jgi:hypothetical protein
MPDTAALSDELLCGEASLRLAVSGEEPVL